VAIEILSESAWLDRQADHERRVDALLAGHRERARTGQPHPVDDFLFTYYSFRPARLRRWHPGAGVALTGDQALERLQWRDYTHLETSKAVTLDLTAFLAHRGQAMNHIIDLLTATAARPAQLGCFGLHEWAMVYRQNAEEVRHNSWPLRLGADGTDAVVETHRIRCTHHDAFRFFTQPARPLNLLQPSRDDQVALEQPGCLHATMDLYKWAYKLSPALPSDLTLACFELAKHTREMDMRASPYDLSQLGYPPIRIETAEGKAEYVAHQKQITGRGQQLRARLLTFLSSLSQLSAGAGHRESVAHR
jgi:hypothetical protein